MSLTNGNTFNMHETDFDYENVRAGGEMWSPETYGDQFHIKVQKLISL